MITENNTPLICWAMKDGEKITAPSVSALGRKLGVGPNIASHRDGRAVFLTRGYEVHVEGGTPDLGPTEAELTQSRVKENLRLSEKKNRKQMPVRESGGPLLRGLVTHGLGQLWRY